MKKIHKTVIIIMSGLLMAGIYSCVGDKFDLRENFSDEFVWNPEIALPVAYGNLTLEDLVKEKKDTIQYISETDLGYGTNDDDLVIQLRYGIDTGRSVDIMRLPIMEPFDTTIKMEPVELNDAQFPLIIRMDDLLSDNFSSADYTQYQTYEANSPTNVAQHTAITHTTYTENLPSSFIDYALFTEGTMAVTATNGFAVPIKYELIVYTDSAGADVQIGTFDFSNNWLQPGESQSATILFDSTYISSTIKYEYRNVQLDAATQVSIDLQNQVLGHNIEITNTIASEGRAFIPEQTLRMDSLIYVTIRDIDSDKKLYKVLIEEGRINYTIQSTIDAATHFIAEFPSMNQNGPTDISREATLNSSSPTQHSSWDLSNLEVDLTTNPEQAYNSMPIHLGYRVNTEAGMMTFGPDQHINIEFTNPDSIAFAFIEANLGKVNEDIFKDTLSFNIEDFISNFLSGEITFYDPKLRIQYTNPFGIPGQLKLNLKGTNSDNESVDVFEGHDNSFDILAPSCDEVHNGEHLVSTIELNKHTSNIVDFVKILPSEIEYSGEFALNHNAEDEDAILNCVSNKGKAELKVEAELPMKLSIKDLVLQQEINLSNMDNIENIEQIERLRIYLYTENMFPLDANVRVSMLDTTLNEGEQNLGELSMYLIRSAKTQGGKVARDAHITKHTEELVLDAEHDTELKKLIQANKLLLEVFLETDQEGDIPVIFYTYYGLNFRMAVDGKFKYKGRFSE
ncbi:MAG: hypothetical protein R6U95_00605 [Bacteroidales bacterium]